MLLDGRLMAAAGLCRKGVTIADVGTDHALLACYLAMNGAKEVYASDVREGPLEAARKTVAEYGVKNVHVVKSDGLREIPYADDVVICGMGGELIARIVTECTFTDKNTHFILQPMTKADALRRSLYQNGFEIDEERTARSAGRSYVVMLVRYTGVCSEPDEVFALTGKVADPDFLRQTAQKLLKRAQGMERGGEHEASRALRDTAQKILEESARVGGNI